MPRWEIAIHDEETRHTLAGAGASAEVVVVPRAERTVVSIAYIVRGIDDATVDRCKRRGEELLVEALRGAAS